MHQPYERTLNGTKFTIIICTGNILPSSSCEQKTKMTQSRILKEKTTRRNCRPYLSHSPFVCWWKWKLFDISSSTETRWQTNSIKSHYFTHSQWNDYRINLIDTKISNDKKKTFISKKRRFLSFQPKSHDSFVCLSVFFLLVVGQSRLFLVTWRTNWAFSSVIIARNCVNVMANISVYRQRNRAASATVMKFLFRRKNWQWDN